MANDPQNPTPSPAPATTSSALSKVAGHVALNTSVGDMPVEPTPVPAGLKPRPEEQYLSDLMNQDAATNAAKDKLYQENPDAFKKQNPFEYIIRKGHDILQKSLVGHATAGVNPEISKSVEPDIRSLSDAATSLYGVPPVSEKSSIKMGMIPEGAPEELDFSGVAGHKKIAETPRDVITPERLAATKDWATRYKLPIDEQGRAQLFHATPTETAAEIEKTGLKKGSKLTDSLDDAQHFAARDRDKADGTPMTKADTTGYEVHLPLDAFHGSGPFAVLDRDVKPEEIGLKRTGEASPAVEGTHPNEEVANSAQRYNTAHAQPEINHAPAELAPQETRNELADEYDRAKHEPENPEVQRAYTAMKKETLDQFKHAQNDLGIKFEFTDKDPYTSAAEMQDDIRNNHKLKVFTGGDIPKDHPLSEIEPETGQSYNNLFRATHDVYGHSAGGHDFSEVGEESAYKAHNQMYSPEARPAVKTETQGQANWYYNNELKRNGGAERFADQKATILPESGTESDATEVEGGDPNLGANDTSFDFGANVPESKYHPDLQKVVDKHGETDDPYAVRNGKSFITPEGTFVHIHSGDHNQTIEAATGRKGDDNRIGFLNDTDTIRTSYSYDRGRGHTLHVTLPDHDITPKAVDALKQAARVANSEHKYGNIIMERTDVASNDKFPPQERPNANANDIEPMLKNLGIHPGPKPWMEQAAEKAKTGGFSAHPGTGVVPTEGKIAEVFPEKRKTFPLTPTPEDIQSFYKENKDLLDKHPELHVGGYQNELNISALGKNAEKVAKKLDQKSIYDLGADKEINTGGRGERTDFSNYPMEHRLKDIAGIPLSEKKGFESLAPEVYDHMEPDERGYLKDNNLLQNNVMKQYHSISPSVGETTNAMQAGAALGGWWQRYINIFHDLTDGGEQVAQQVGPSHAETLKQWHAALSANKNVADANNLAWHSYADWLDAGKPTDRKSIDDIIRKNGAQPVGSGKKGNAALSDTIKKGKVVFKGLDTTKIFNLVNSPEMKGKRPFSNEVFNDAVPNALANIGEGARKLPSMGATVAGKGNLNRLVIDAHIRDFYGHKNTAGPAAQYIADSVHLRQAAEALGLKGGEGQEQLWGTVLGLKTLLKQGLTPAEAAGTLDAQVIQNIGKDYAEVIANDPEITKPGGVLDRLKQHGIGQGSAGFSETHLPARSTNTGPSGPPASQGAVNQTELAKTGERIKGKISPSQIKKPASAAKKAKGSWADFLKENPGNNRFLK